MDSGKKHGCPDQNTVWEKWGNSDSESSIFDCEASTGCVSESEEARKHLSRAQEEAPRDLALQLC